MLRRWIEIWELSIFADDLDERLPREFAWGIDELADVVPENLRHVEAREALIKLGRELSVGGDGFYSPPRLQEEGFD